MEGVDREPGWVVTAAPLGFAAGWSLAIPISRVGPWGNVRDAVGWALASCRACVEVFGGDEPCEAEGTTSTLVQHHVLPCRNYTLKSMPLPMSDVAQAYRSNPEKTEEAVHKVCVRV